MLRLGFGLGLAPGVRISRGRCTGRGRAMPPRVPCRYSYALLVHLSAWGGGDTCTDQGLDLTAIPVRLKSVAEAAANRQ